MKGLEEKGRRQVWCDHPAKEQTEYYHLVVGEFFLLSSLLLLLLYALYGRKQNSTRCIFLLMVHLPIA
jgi:hypothetical protein